MCASYYLLPIDISQKLLRDYNNSLVQTSTIDQKTKKPSIMQLGQRR